MEYGLSQVQHTTSVDAKMAYPRYTDQRFLRPQLVYMDCFLDALDGLRWEYTDRLAQFDYDKWKTAHSLAIASANSDTARRWHVFVDSYFDGRRKLMAIMAGYNAASGHPYWVLGLQDLGGQV